MTMAPMAGHRSPSAALAAFSFLLAGCTPAGANMGHIVSRSTVPRARWAAGSSLRGCSRYLGQQMETRASLVPYGRKRRKTGGVDRSERLEVLYQRVLQFEFDFGLEDRALEDVKLERVEMQGQLSTVRVWVSGNADRADEIKEGLKRCKGYLRSVMSREVQIMRTPDIKFIFLPVEVRDPFLNERPTTNEVGLSLEDIQEGEVFPRTAFGDTMQGMMASQEDMVNRLRSGKQTGEQP
uniref:Ribosome-binding factor A n=1 Tax=Lotharella globosa TaxID=91324 RepID=A0A7S3Z983_9EUKA